MTLKTTQFLARNILRNSLFHNYSSGVIYEKTRIKNKHLDANTLYLLDKYARYGGFIHTYLYLQGVLNFFLKCKRNEMRVMLLVIGDCKKIIASKIPIDEYFRYTPAAISIKRLLEHGRDHDPTDSFLFLKKEIPTRLANMIMELKLLPEA